MTANSTHKLQTENPDATSRLAQASAEYEKLSASLSELGSQLAALGVAIRGQASTVNGTLNAASSAPATLPRSSETDRLSPTEDESGIMRVFLLGSFTLVLGGRNISAHMPGQVQTVLKYLLSQGGRPVSKDALLDLLWPDADPSVTGSRLRVLMHTLRRGVPNAGLGFRDFVVLTGNNFIINPQARLWTDADEFERNWHAGWRMQRAGDLAGALREYERAEALYRGDYLEDDLYADWTLLRREALRDAYSTILTLLATMSIQSGDHTGAIIWAQKLLAQDNCREDAYRLLMSSHQSLGQTSRALYWYALCTRTLSRELGMQPSAETQQLHSSLAQSTAGALR